MPIPVQTPRTTRNGNSSATVFNYSFKITDAAQLAAFLNSADDTPVVISNVTGVGSNGGGTYTYNPGTPLPTGQTITAYLNPELKQPEQITNQGNLYLNVIQQVLDNLALQVQAVNDKVNRAPKLSASTSLTESVSLALTAGGILYVNATGDGILSTEDSYGSIASSLAILAPIAADISATAAIDTEIVAVAGNATNINTVASNISNVNAVGSISANVTTVAGIAANVTTVAGIGAAVSNVSSISAAVSGVSSISAAVSGVNAIASNVTTVAGISANVTTVAGIASNVTAVAGNATNINTVASNITNINTVVANLTDIQNADDNAAAAVAAKVAAEAARDAAIAAAGNPPDGDKGDIVVSSGGTSWAVDNNAVTYAKMQDVSATSRILGRRSAGAGDPEECTLSQILDFIGSAAEGDILYRGASTWTRLTKGTALQNLRMNAGATAPEWATVSGLTFLTQQNSTSGTSIDFSVPTTASRITVMLRSVSTNGTSNLMVQIGTGGSPTTSGYQSASTDFNGTGQGGGSNTNGFYLNATASAGANYNAVFVLERLGSSDNNWLCTGLFETEGSAQSGFTCGGVGLAGALNLVRVTTVAGTAAFDAGVINVKWE